MKRMIVLLAGAMTLSSCSAMFDVNILGGVDGPAPANKDALGKYTSQQVGDIALSPNVSDRQVFFKQLKADPAALLIVQNILVDTMTNGTTAEQADAAKAFVAVTANGTASMTVANAAVPALLNLAIGGGAAPTTAAGAQDLAASFFAGMSTAEITSTLKSMVSISSALTTLQAAETASPTTVDFFAGTSSGDVAQVGAVAAMMTALISATNLADPTGADLPAAAGLVAGLLTTADPSTYINNNFTSIGTITASLTDVQNGITGSGATTYTYLANLKTALTP